MRETGRRYSSTNARPSSCGRITSMGAYLILALDVALLRSVVEVSAGLFNKRLED